MTSLPKPKPSPWIVERTVAAAIVWCAVAAALIVWWPL